MYLIHKRMLTKNVNITNKRKLLKPAILLGLMFFITGHVLADPLSSDSRIMFSLNDHWKFLPEGAADAFETDFDDSRWEVVSLPHTWNARDPFDDDGTYKRGIGWYRKKLVLDQRFKDKEIFLNFEGANQVADVYVNGAFVGEHKGGYTAFTFDVTPFLKWNNGRSENTIAIQVNNAHNPFIPPLDIGYALYGGIYRDAWLIATDKLHFSAVNDNSGGVYITTPQVSAEKATVSVKTTISNQTGQDQNLQFVNFIYDMQGNEIATFSKELTVRAGGEQEIRLSGREIKNPHLWSPEYPYLYQVKSRLIQNGRVIDEVNNPLGFRWFSFDPDTGFTLNGHKYILHGTTRHQDMQGKGSALSDEDDRRDIQMIKNMGANFIRMAHYPQAPELLRLADQLGIIIWEEVPVVNYMTIQPGFLHNAENMIREMVRQNYNHPSVIMWGSMNEILLYSKEGQRIQHHVKDTAYIRSLRGYAVKLDSTIRAEDPTRYTTMAMHLSDDYAKYKLDRISQVAGHNIYDGWYGGKTEDFGKHLDRIHKLEPHQIIFVSEYGAETDQRVNTEHPVRMDCSGEYQRYYHESYLRQIKQRPYLAGTAIWNEFDFSQPNIGGTIPNINQKGMATWDRKPKDVYYLYKANWNPEPMVYIASRDWQKRAGTAGALSTIDVYSNLKQVTLYVNGKSQGVQNTNDINKCSWKVQLQDGDNVILASGYKNNIKYTDRLIIQYQVYQDRLNSSEPFRSLAVNIGSNTQYLDEAGTIWIEDRPYQKGSFGYISGDPKFFNRKQVIKNTDDVPLYYSYREGIRAYRLDVPDGIYKVTLCFAENDSLHANERVFNVSINDKPVIRNLDLVADYGFEEAVKRTFMVEVKNKTGINITFDAVKGQPVLSGLKVEQYYAD
jgi:beta-galactosidase